MPWIVNDVSGVCQDREPRIKQSAERIQQKGIRGKKHREEIKARWKTKKIGAESSDPNRNSQPRLPGSVVGEASMPLEAEAGQDYRSQCPEVTQAQRLRIGLTPSIRHSVEATRYWLSLLRRHQRMCNRVHRQCNPVLHAHLAHQLCHVCLYRALFDPQLSTNLFIGAPRHQHLQYFLFAVGEGHPSGGENPPWRRRHPLNEHRKHSPRRPHRSLAHNADRLREF